MTGSRPPTPERSRVAPWVVLGVGFGAFVDGIVLHQILQWHHMLSARAGDDPRILSGLEANTVADGAFHLAALVAVAIGVVLLRRDQRRGVPALGGRRTVGALALGWGLFNVVEGLVDHHLLRVHHVRDDVGDPAAWDVGFLALSALLCVVGLALSGALTRRRHRPPSR